MEENSSTAVASMHRSVSMTDAPKTLNTRLLRSDECETLDEVPSESEMSLDHESFSKDISAKLEFRKM